MSQAPVELKIAGQSYRVVTSASPDELDRLAQSVENALDAVTPPGRQVSPQAFVLAAISLAHDLETERAKLRALEERYRSTLGRWVGRLDALLQEEEEPELILARSGPSRGGHGGIERDDSGTFESR